MPQLDSLYNHAKSECQEWDTSIFKMEELQYRKVKKYDQIHTTSQVVDPGLQQGLLKILPFFCHLAVDAAFGFDLQSSHMTVQMLSVWVT